MRFVTPALLAAAAMTVFSGSAAQAQFVKGVNFGNPDGNYAVQDVTIDGHLLTAEPAALSSGGLSYDAAFQHFDYHEVFGLSPLSPAVPTDVDNALAATLLLPAGEPTGSIHETVANGQAYSVTLYYIEGYDDNNRSWDLSGDLTATGLGLLPYDTWTSVTLNTPVITDGSIDFTVTTTLDQPVISALAISLFVPEPASCALLLPLGVLALRSRRRAR